MPDGNGGPQKIDFDSKVKEEVLRGQIGPNLECAYYPCHFPGLDCSLCFCPFYPCEDYDLGEFVESKRGGMVWSCSNCLWIHRGSVAGEAITLLGELEKKPSREKLDSIRSELEKRHPKRARSLMVLGATSGAGKSLTVAALCRIFSDLGYEVSPFKSQNMSLNSMVTPEGEEIARIQVLQAMAARKEPNARMNPILVKPKGGMTSQIIVEGRPYRDIEVKEYYTDFTLTEGVEIVRRSFDFLSRSNDIVIGEGAGSPAEINIYDLEIANMKTAEIMDAACILVVNIEWGGSFAHILGTLDLLKEEHRRMFKGVIINNMRGLPDILKEGIIKIEELTGVPVLGVVPHIDLYLPDEDSMGLSSMRKEGSNIDIGVIRLPMISNYTDFDALGLEKDVSVIFIDKPRELQRVNAIIIPGSKNSVADLVWMRETGIFDAIKELEGKIPILGICGGFQIMGRRILDPECLEGQAGPEIEGLCLLDCETRFDAYDKRTIQVKGQLLVDGSLSAIKGYEIHMGKTEIGDCSPLFQIEESGGLRSEGAISKDKMCMGTYMHGLFDLPSFRRFFLELVTKSERDGDIEDHDSLVEENLDKLAEVVRNNIDMDAILKILKL
ncbi:MAG TPA: cobyric acid synthase [Methanomassiliicoccales archaeon]|nr:cobyric acid synthase [Methanomassiliicoccales archaeon]